MSGSNNLSKPEASICLLENAAVLESNALPSLEPSNNVVLLLSRVSGGLPSIAPLAIAKLPCVAPSTDFISGEKVEGNTLERGSGVLEVVALFMLLLLSAGQLERRGGVADTA